ncbi:hypothetical protein NDU88_007704 [Pleurodeles waltl]|uniref:Uncharacterized protein n=1 Tax=Pleurodeles waltl TaxID=8319 RepID=A0AAV7N476_PLEWA|nr:hypothetical protein NDU88_007704 [Pleurodeles waltl]
MVENAAAVREALRVLCEAGRDDLIQPDILSQAWVGLERPKHVTACGVATAVLACLPLKQRSNRNMNARCLGDKKRKIKKESPSCAEWLTGSSVAGVLGEERRGRAYTGAQAAAGRRLVSEGRASGECIREMGSGMRRAMSAPPAEQEKIKDRHESEPEREQFLSNASA